MKLSDRIQTVKPSVTLGITAKAKAMKAEGKDIISLSAGEPDFDTPDFIKNVSVKALQNGVTKYTPAIGSVELRQAISRKFKKDQDLDFPIDQIIVGCGAKHSIFNVLFALVNEGDEVIMSSPYWLSYPEMVGMLGGKSVVVSTTEKTGFKLTADMLEKAITPKTKVLILNSPSNPTGAVYSKKELASLAVVLKKYPYVTIISDEIYEKLIFDGEKHYSIATIDSEIAKQTVIVNGHSKAYSMTGWRLGYAAMPNKGLAKAVGSFQSHSTSNPNSFAQAGGVEALEKGDEETKKMRDIFQKRRDFFIEQLKKVPCFKPFKATGAFYLFVNIKETGLTALELTEKLLEEAHVAVVPGEPFGDPNHIRMSFATSEKMIEAAVKRIADWTKTL